MAKIKLEVGRCAFPVGGCVAGVVNLVVDEPLPIRGMRVKLYGYERELHGVPPRSPFEGLRAPRAGKGAVELFNEEIVLTGREPFPSCAESLADAWVYMLGRRRYPTLQPGDYGYPFSIDLPHDLLPTYVGGRCEVRYFLTAYVDIPRGFGWQRPSACKEINVLALPVDGKPASKTVPESAAGVGGKAALTVGVGSDSLAPGGKLAVQYRIGNPGGQSIRGIRGSIVRVESTKRRGSESKSEEEIARHFQPFEDPAAREQGGEFSLPVPTDAAPSFEGRCAAVRYELRVKAEVARDFDAEVALDIEVAPSSLGEQAAT